MSDVFELVKMSDGNWRVATHDAALVRENGVRNITTKALETNP